MLEPSALPGTPEPVTNTPSAPDTPQTSSPPVKTSMAEKMARAAARLNGQLPEQAPAQKLASVPTKLATEVLDSPPASEPKAVETAPDAKHDARLAKAMADLVALEKARREAAQTVEAERAERTKVLSEKEQLAKDLADMRKAHDELKEALKDPKAALKMGGHKFAELARKHLAGELAFDDDAVDLAGRVEESVNPLKSELEKLKEQLAAKEAAEAARAEEQRIATQRASDLEVVKQTFTAAADAHPMASTLFTPEFVLEKCYEQGVADPNEMLAALEKAALADVERLLASEKVLAAIRKQPSLRDKVWPQQSAAQTSRKDPPAEGPRALAKDMVSAPTSPVDRPLSKKERMEKAKALLLGGQK